MRNRWIRRRRRRLTPARWRRPPSKPNRNGSSSCSTFSIRKKGGPRASLLRECRLEARTFKASSKILRSEESGHAQDQRAALLPKTGRVFHIRRRRRPAQLDLAMAELPGRAGGEVEVFLLAGRSGRTAKRRQRAHMRVKTQPIPGPDSRGNVEI